LLKEILAHQWRISPASFFFLQPIF
jgi:hypothetical protein